MSSINDSESPATILFLQDAEDRREYALPFYSGKPGDPLQAFTPGRRANFKPNERVIAFSDQTKIWLDSGIRIEAQAIEIPTDETGRPVIADIKRADVLYQTYVENAHGDYSIVFELTQESRALVEEKGFRKNFPPFFETMIRPENFPRSDLRKSALDVEEMRHLPLLPHHSSLAQTARRIFMQKDPARNTDAIAGAWRMPAVATIGFNAAAIVPPVRTADGKPAMLETKNLSLIVTPQPKRPA